MADEKKDHTAIAREFIMHTIRTVDDQDFAFSVEADGISWEVYRFTTSADQQGMVAFRIVDEHIDIGFFRRGSHFTPDDVRCALTKDVAN